MTRSADELIDEAARDQIDYLQARREIAKLVELVELIELAELPVEFMGSA